MNFLREFGLGTAVASLFGMITAAMCLSPAATAAPVLLVVDEDDLVDVPGNESIFDRLVQLGHDVEMVDDDVSQSVDPTGKELIVISSSVASGNVGTHFTLEPIPLINWESALWDELEMSDSGANIAGQYAIDVVETDHPLAEMMGLTELGEVEVRDFETTFHGGRYGGLAPGATVIAEQAGGGDPLIAVVEEGGELRDGSLAEAIRIGLFFGDEGLDGVTDAGLAIFDGAVSYALGDVGGGAVALQPGDADQDLDFDQFDIIKVQVAAKYLTGQPATWGEGDWDGGPGGEQGSPPAGNGTFDQLDIVAALAAGKYLTGPYGALAGTGTRNDAQTSVGYDASTGEVFVDAPAGVELTSINIDSAAGIFTGDAAQNLGGSFDNDANDNIFKATFGGSFGSISFGNVAQPGLSEEVVMNDLTVVGSLAGGGELGAVDLIYVPEPSAALLAAIGLALILGVHRRGGS